MKKLSSPFRSKVFVGVLSILALATAASAATVASWTNSALNNSGSVAASVGTGTLSRGLGVTYANTANVFAATNWPNAELTAPTFSNRYYDVAVNTTGFGSLTLNFTHTVDNSNGPTTVKVYYSSTGAAGTFTNSGGGPYTVSTAGSNVILNLSAVTAINNNPNTVFRIEAYGASNSGKEYQLSGLSVTGTDIVPPTVTSINRVNASPTNATTVNYTVTFSESVTGVAANNFTLVGGGVTGVIGAVTGTGTTRNVAINTVSGNGTLRLDLDQNLANIKDTANNAMTASFTTGQSYTIDQTAPTVSSISRANTSPTFATSVSYDITFSESVTGFSAANLTLSVTGTATGVIGTITGTGTTRNVTITGVGGNGTITLSLDKTITTVIDTAGNTLGVTFIGESYTIDQRPVVSSITRADANPTSATTVNFTVTFNESVTGVTGSNFSIVATGVTGSIGTVTGSGTTWNVPVTTATGNGTIRVDLNLNLSNITDSVGNTLGTSFTAGQSYTIDQVAPSVISIVRASTNPTSAASVNFTVTLSESVTGLTTANFTAAGTGVTGTVSSVTGSGASYTVTVNTIAGSGTLQLDLDQNLSSVSDSAFNHPAAFTAGLVYTVDRVAPTVLSITRVNPSPTSLSTVNYTVTFSESVTGLTAANFSLTLSGVTATIGTVSGSGTTYNVQITSVSGTGSLTLNLNQNLTTIIDSLNNQLSASFIGETYTVGTPNISIGSVTLSGGNGDGYFDANECNQLSISLNNTGAVPLSNITAVLSTTKPGAFATQSTSSYPALAIGASSPNDTLFLVSTTSTFDPTSVTNFTLTITTSQGTLVRTFTSSLPATTTTRYDNSTPVAIPDSPHGGKSASVDSPITVSGLSGTVTSVTVLMYLTHIRDNDLRVTLIAPDGTQVILTNKHGGPGDNYGASCSPDSQRTTFDDTASLAIGSGSAPFVGSFRPDSPLTLFRNKDGSVMNGIWKLRVTDTKPSNVGTLNCWSLKITASPLGQDGGTCPSTPTADIQLTKTGAPASVSNLQNITYTLGVTNLGTTTATNIVLEDPLPGEVDYVSGSAVGGGVVTVVGDFVSITWPSLAVNASTTATIIVQAQESGTISNTANISADQADVNLNNNSATAINAVGATSLLTVTNTDSPDPQITGSNVTYTVGVTNAGPDDASAVVLTDVLGAGLTYVNSSSTSGTCVPSGNTVICNIGALAIDEAVTVTITASSTVCGITTNTASVTNPEADLVPADNSVAQTTTFNSPAPFVAIGPPSLTTTNTGLVDFTVTYTGAATENLTPAKITLNATGTSTGTITVLNGSTATPTVRISSITGNGTLGISIGAATATACGGATAPAAGPSTTFLVDNVVPTATVTGPASPTNASPISFTVNFSESVSGLTAAGFTVTGGTKGSLTGSGSGPYTLPVSPTANGAVTCQVNAGAASDAAGNGNAVSNNLSITYDNTAPTATVTGPTSPMKGSPVNFTINFSESVTGLTASGISVTGGTKGTLTGSGSGPYTMPVTPTADGTVTCQVNAGAAADAATNGNAVSNNLSITYDSTAPTATVTGPASPTNGSPINFTLSFSESVTGLTASGITVTGGTKGTLSGSGSGPYTMPVTPTADGAVTCQVNAGAAADAATNGNTVSNNLSITYDGTAPTATVTGPSSPSNGNPINFTINFSESVTSLTASGITVTGGTKGTLSGSGSGPYTMPVTPTANGAVTCQVNAGAAQDAAGNNNIVSNNLSITYDSTAPTATVTGPASPTNVSPINFTINFSESVTGLTAAGITVTGGTKGTLTGSGSGPYTMPVTPTADGAVTCQVDASAAQDTAGNNNTVSNNLSITYDGTVPTATVTGPASPTSGSPINFTINFSEAVSGLTETSITVTNGTKGTLTGSGSGPYTLPVTPTADGAVTCQVDAGAAQDSAGNGNSVSNNLSITYDGSAPTVTSIIRADASPTGATTVNFTVTFSENVNGIDGSIFTFSGSGVTGSIGTITGSGTTWNVPVTGLVGLGTIGLDQTTSGSVVDGVGNALAGTSTGEQYNIVRLTVYVATSGSDSSGDGTAINPFLTIQNAISQVSDGGTVNVGSGTYTGHLTIAKDLTFIGDPGSLTIAGPASSAPVIDATNTGRALDIAPGVSVTVSGFVLTNGVPQAIRNQGILAVSDSTISNSPVGLLSSGGITTATLNRISGNGNGVEYDGGELVASLNYIQSNTNGVMIDAGWDISAANLHFNYNHIQSNTSGSQNLASAGTLDAVNNWWGSVYGPLAPSNTLGKGNPVSTNVSFDPWYGKGSILDDVDGDGIWTADEDINLNGSVDAGESNPASRDSDADGFEDGVEVRYGSDANSSLSSPPSGFPYNSTADTDGDGYKDFYDYALGYDPSVASSHPLLGDVNGDGLVNGADAIILKRIAVGTLQISAFNANAMDFNRDGVVNGADAIILQRYVVHTVTVIPTL